MKNEWISTTDDFDSDIVDSVEALLSDSQDDYAEFDMDQLNALLAEDLPDADFKDPAPVEEAPKAQNSTRKSFAAAPSRKAPFRFPKSNKRMVLLVSGVVGLVLLCLIGGILIKSALDPYGNRVLPNTTIGGIDVGGMTRMDAYRALKDATASTFTEQPMEVHLPDGTIALSPDNTKARLKTWAAASAAFQLGRKGTEEERQTAYSASQSGGNTVELLPYLKLDQEYIRSQLEEYASQHNVAHTELQYRLEGTQPALAEDQHNESAPHQTLELTLGTPLQELDVDSVLATILDAYSQNSLQVTIESIEYKTKPADPDLDALYQEFYIAPVNTTLDMTAYKQIPGAYGYSLDMEAAEKLIAQAQYGDTVSIPMTYVKPEILGDETYFREELGYCETKHTDNENRNTNLTLACAAMDGLILQPGEEFSYNTVVGERTAEKGYKPAAAYSGTRTVNSIGGGVCQVSSTLYNAALIADMEIVHRVNHGFRSSYIGVGLDATVNWGGPDFQFRNNSHFPVMIKAEVSDGYVKVWLYGTDEKDYYIKMTSGYDEDDNFVYSWSYKNKYDKKTDELISKEREAYSCYMK